MRRLCAFKGRVNFQIVLPIITAQNNQNAGLRKNYRLAAGGLILQKNKKRADQSIKPARSYESGNPYSTVTLLARLRG
jgi:hypothetical protein